MAHRGSRGIALPFHDHDSRRGEGSVSCPGHSLPLGKTRYPLYRRVGGPQGRSGQVRKISPPPGFDPRTVQSQASRYTNCATRPRTPCRDEIILTVQKGKSLRPKDVWGAVGKIHPFVDWLYVAVNGWLHVTLSLICRKAS